MNPVFKCITSIAEVSEFISQEKGKREQFLVIFDMDLTLTMPHLPVLIYLSIPEYRAKVENILSSLQASKRRKVLTLGLQVSEQQLVESNSPQIIRHIQDQDIRTIVLTASLSGQLNNKAPMELQRFQKLQTFGIVLEKSCPHKEILLDELPFYNSSYPTYYRGILCANGEPGTNIKGPVLISFLQRINFLPRKVIMVDDKIQHLSSVYESLISLDPTIDFVGFEYVGAYRHIPNNIDEEDFIAYWKELINRVN
jgi:hypothetical protein